jgi:hypothetical protein
MIGPMDLLLMVVVRLVLVPVNVVVYGVISVE